MSDNSWQPPTGPSEGDDAGPDDSRDTPGKRDRSGTPGTSGADPLFGQQPPPSPYRQPPAGQQPGQPPAAGSPWAPPPRQEPTVWREPEVELWWDPPAEQNKPAHPTPPRPAAGPQAGQPGQGGQGGQDQGGQGANPWQSAYPADPSAPHPATQSPYEPRPVEGVPPGWQFPPPLRPGQPPSGPTIMLPRGAFGTPPRRRTRKGLIAVVAALAVLIAGTGIAIAVRNRSGDEPAAGGGATPAAETTSPTPSPTPTPTPTPKPTPKPKPRPKPPTAFQIVAQNKLYRTGLAGASRCKEPGFRPTSYATVRAYYTRFLPCLNRTWYPVVKQAGARYRSPKLVVFGGTLPTPCGRTSIPYYCGSNETIYMPWPAAVKAYKTNQAFARATMAVQISHEYGHHVQMMTGILQASFARSATIRTTPGKQLESRRRELQATCFGGVYLGADKRYFPVSGQLATMWRFVVTHMGDEYDTRMPKVPDHGGRAYNGYWSGRGFNGINPGLCNTFAASQKTVR
jgi:predicted metalloprotease